MRPCLMGRHPRRRPQTRARAAAPLHARNALPQSPSPARPWRPQQPAQRSTRPSARRNAQRQRGMAAGSRAGAAVMRRRLHPSLSKSRRVGLLGAQLGRLPCNAADAPRCFVRAASQTQALLHRFLETQLDMSVGAAQAPAAPPAADADGSGSDGGGGFRVFGKVTRGAPVVLAGARLLPRATHAQRCDSRAAPQACCTQRGVPHMRARRSCRRRRRCARLGHGAVTRPTATTKTRCVVVLSYQLLAMAERSVAAAPYSFAQRRRLSRMPSTAAHCACARYGGDRR